MFKKKNKDNCKKIPDEEFEYMIYDEIVIDSYSSLEDNVINLGDFVKKSLTSTNFSNECVQENGIKKILKRFK